MEIARAKESRISPHQPTVPFSAHHEETRQRMKRAEMSDQRVDQVSFTIYAIYIEDNVTVLKVSLNIVKDLCQIDLTPIRNFKYCITIENKWFKSLQT